MPIVGTSQLKKNPNIAFQIGLRSIEIEVADGNARVVTADARIDRFADDAIHASERAYVDNRISTVPGKVDAIAGVDDHLAVRAKRRQVWLLKPQDLTDTAVFLVAVEILTKKRSQRVFIFALKVISHMCAESLEGEALSMEV